MSAVCGTTRKMGLRMKRTIEIELTNLYGSAEFPREIEILKPKMSRIKSRKRTSNRLGNLTQETQTHEETTEKQIEKVNSFKHENGKPTIRLGGSYGKFYGLLKEAGLLCVIANDPSISSKTEVLTISKAIQIIPEFPPLELNGCKIETISGLVGVNSGFGGRQSHKPTTWDIIPKAKTSITLIYPDAFDKQIKAMLKMSENINFAERRRGKVKILSKL